MSTFLTTLFSPFLDHPKIITVFSIGLISTSLIFLLLIYGPVIKVEAKYQYQHFLIQTFNVSSIRELILPNLKFDYQGQSSHPDFGLVIPAIFLDEPAIPDVDPNDEPAYTSALKKGIAHAAGTSLPGGSGVGYYFAHSSSPELRTQYNAVFYLLGKLKPGDEVFLWYKGKKHLYKVTHTQETMAEDISFLDVDDSQSTIVLQTCWPAGTTAKRLLVFATLQDQP